MPPLAEASSKCGAAARAEVANSAASRNVDVMIWKTLRAIIFLSAVRGDLLRPRARLPKPNGEGRAQGPPFARRSDQPVLAVISSIPDWCQTDNRPAPPGYTGIWSHRFLHVQP